jgi:hypothetical protein
MNDYIEVNGEKVKIPDVALGKTAPHYVEKLQREEFLRKRAERKADLYFVGGLLGTLAGTILGWLLAKFC